MNKATQNLVLEWLPVVSRVAVSRVAVAETLGRALTLSGTSFPGGSPNKPLGCKSGVWEVVKNWNNERVSLWIPRAHETKRLVPKKKLTGYLHDRVLRLGVREYGPLQMSGVWGIDRKFGSGRIVEKRSRCAISGSRCVYSFLFLDNSCGEDFVHFRRWTCLVRLSLNDRCEGFQC